MSEELTSATEPPSLLALIDRAVTQRVDTQQLEKLIELQERYERNVAKKEFDQAKASAEAEMPVIVRDKINNFTSKKYASLETVLETIKPTYTKYGFSMDFDEVECKTPGMLRIRCDLSHRGGYTKQFYAEYPIDGTGSQGGKSSMNPIQARGSTKSYARRYLACDVWNLVIADQDTDGSVEGATINPNQVREINEAIETARQAGAVIDWKRFLDYLGIEDLGQLRQRDMTKALLAIKQRQTEAEKKAREAGKK